MMKNIDFRMLEIKDVSQCLNRFCTTATFYVPNLAAHILQRSGCDEKKS